MAAILNTRFKYEDMNTAHHWVLMAGPYPLLSRLHPYYTFRTIQVALISHSLLGLFPRFGYVTGGATSWSYEMLRTLICTSHA